MSSNILKPPTIKILWIDDDKSHEEDAKNLMHEFKYLLISVIHPKQIDEKLSEMKKTGEKVDLFLVDYYLNQKSFDHEKYLGKGLSVAGILKENYPEYPVYGLSDKENKGIFGSEAQPAKEIFDRLLKFEVVQNKGADILYWDARDYNKIKATKKNNLEALIELLRPPEALKDRIRQILPDELKSGLYTKKEGNSIAFARWIQEKFLFNPGFLYDNLYAATHLGITEQCFCKLKNQFKKAKYTGIFSETNVDLWWVSELEKIVFTSNKIKKYDFEYIWEVAPLIYGVPKKDYSKCIKCGKIYPELVGINICNEDHKAPVHYGCSEPYPLIKRELLFDEVRGFTLNSK